MPTKCNDTTALLNFVSSKHPTAKASHPSGLLTKIDFPDGLVMNVFNNGTINFQGNSHENQTRKDLEAVIEALNR